MCQVGIRVGEQDTIIWYNINYREVFYLFNYDTVENVSNTLTYNYYYSLFLTYVFPILLLILLILIIVYLSFINKKLSISSDKEIKLDENNDCTNSKKQSKTLYELTLIPSLICLSIFLIMFFVALFSSL